MASLRKVCKNSRCLLQLYCLPTAMATVLPMATIAILAGSVCYSAPQAQSVASEGVLTVEDVVKMSRAGFAEELIVTKIKKNGKAFDLSTDEMFELKKQGLSDALIKVLLDPTQPLKKRGVDDFLFPLRDRHESVKHIVDDPGIAQSLAVRGH